MHFKLTWIETAPFRYLEVICISICTELESKTCVIFGIKVHNIQTKKNNK